jgi:hemolysin activation/secretion protein
MSRSSFPSQSSRGINVFNPQLGRTAIAAAISVMLWTVDLPEAAAAPPDQAPGAGQLLQELPPPAMPKGPPPSVNFATPARGIVDDGKPFHVESIEITGNTLIDSSTLQSLVAGSERTDMTLRQAVLLADQITALYQKDGYPLARAIVPAQTLEGGKLRIQVIEARYDKLSLANQSLVTGGVLESTLASIESGQVVAQAPLDDALLLMSDLPGVKINATLSPGAEVGTTDLDIVASPGARIAGSVILDDAGNRFTGRARLSGNLFVASPLGLGDQFTANVLTSGSDLNEATVGYAAPVFNAANRVGMDYSALDYRLGESLSPIDAHGTATVADLWVSHSFVRGADFDSSARVEFARKQLDDTVGSTDLRTDRHSDAITVSWLLDSKDQLFGGGVNSLNLSGSVGQLSFDSADAGSFDAKTAKTAGRFAKLDLALSRTQVLDEDTNLFVSTITQLSSANLDSSEQLVAGGATSARGYDVGAVSGDEGELSTIELRRRVPLPLPGAWQIKAFFDNAYLKVDKQQWVASPNTAHLNSVGVGLDWLGVDQWTARIDVAKRVGSAPSILGEATSDVRVWAQLTKSF